MYRACLDPGHGGADGRANVGPTGYSEADGNLKIAYLVVEYLKLYPVEVTLTRTLADETVSINRRCAIASECKADLLVSIHSNAHPDPTIRGTETYHSIRDSYGRQSSRLATLIHAGVVGIAGTLDHGIRARRSDQGDWDYYGIIRDCVKPAVICEVAYHSNRVDEALLQTDAFRRRAAQGIARGIVEYAGLLWVAPELAGLRGRLEQIKALVEDYSYQKQ